MIIKKEETKSGEKIKYLEGLRGIAAIVVVFGHLKNTCFISHQQYLYSLIKQSSISEVFKSFIIKSLDKMVDGGISVWIFWVLSSYVISLQFFKPNKDYNKILISSFSKRYFRLLIPVLASVIIAYALLRCGLMYNTRLAALLGHTSDDWLNTFYNFNANFLLALKSAFYETFFNYQFSTTYNSSLWTIENEFLGSLFIFAVFGVIRHNSMRHVLYLIILLILLQLKLQWLCAFVVGYILSDYDYSVIDNKYLNFIKKIESKVHSFSFIALVFSIIFIVFSDPIMTLIGIPFSYHMLILCIFIVYFCLRNKYYKSFFSSKIPFWLGKVSFGLYLIHLPIICSLTSYLILHNNTLQGKIMASVITLIVALVGAHFFTKYIDKKSIKFSNHIGNYFKNASSKSKEAVFNSNETIGG